MAPLTEILRLRFILDPPEVEIEVTRLPSQAREGDEMILECQVKRSNPAPWNYRWYKNSVELSHAGTRYRKTLVATDKGVYTCAADNTAGPSPRSQTVWIDVQCECHSFSRRSVLSQQFPSDSVTQ